MKKQMNQAELIKRMTDKELLFNLYFSQGILVVIAIVSSFFLFDSFYNWFHQLKWDPVSLFLLGLLPALAIVLVDLVLMKLLPESYYDDGGINVRIFKNRGIAQIFMITLFVALSEEMLFRGVIQHEFGYLIASVLFALIHFRYLGKPVLLISILSISFFIGYLYEITENLAITITAHFFVDFILALIIKFKWGDLYGVEETS
ncbi:CPBP family intramembrane glutamic endopeptidase [Virgibacillus sp. MSP4-1]|uniref:CPBP family intramembrane glutamic endopeptidase n=1 Tax=Virgibacillus sp. MSP4-1 TaxID=2700081 RepID=UPI0003A453CF|nr:type II CAAX endopeptidase family protein [Virgibacillus sp. MSP4-1]